MKKAFVPCVLALGLLLGQGPAKAEDGESTLNKVTFKGEVRTRFEWNEHMSDPASDADDSEGWLDTGDQAKLENGFLYITGRIKEIIVMANGEKVPPVDMELAIQLDPLLEQALVVGEGKPFLGALVALNMDAWPQVAEAAGLGVTPTARTAERAEKLVLARIAKQVHAFPGYAQVRRVALLTEKWTVDNGLLTPTLKPNAPGSSSATRTGCRSSTAATPPDGVEFKRAFEIRAHASPTSPGRTARPAHHSHARGHERAGHHLRRAFS